MFIIIVIIVKKDWITICIQFWLILRFGLAHRDHIGVNHGFLTVLVTHLIAKCCFKINHVTQQNIFVQKFVAPNGDCLKCQRAFTKTQNHRIAARFNTLCDCNLAFARQQLHRAHFAQIHTDRIIGTIKLFIFIASERNFFRTCSRNKVGCALVFVFHIFVFDDVYAHFGKHRHHVFDLLRRYLIGRKHLIKLIIGYVTALACFCDHLFDGGLAHVQGHFRVLVFRLAIFGIFGSHSALLYVKG